MVKILKDSTSKKMIAKANRTVLSHDEMFTFAKEAGLLDAEDRNFDGHTITAIRVFDADENKVLSVMFRMEALARLVREGIPGWTGSEQPNGAIMTHAAIFAATGVEPLIERDGKLVFDREAFLRRVFQIGKDLLKE